MNIKSPYQMFKGTKEQIDEYLWEVYEQGKIFLLKGNKVYQLHYSENAGFNLSLLYVADKSVNYYGRGRHKFLKAADCNYNIGFELVKD